MIVFKSKIRNYSTFVKVDGATRRISFRDRGLLDSFGYYICTSDAVASALRKHPAYGDIILCADEDKPAEEAPARVYDAVYPDVRRTQEANTVLQETYGVDKELLKSKADALKKADELNIAFPNLK